MKLREREREMGSRKRVGTKEGCKKAEASEDILLG